MESSLDTQENVSGDGASTANKSGGSLPSPEVLLGQAQGTAQRYFEYTGKYTGLKRWLFNAALAVLLLCVLVLGAVGFVAVVIFAFIGRLVLMPILFLFYLAQILIFSAVERMAVLLVGGLIIVGAVWYLQHKYPTVWDDMGLAWLRVKGSIGNSFEIVKENVPVVEGLSTIWNDVFNLADEQAGRNMAEFGNLKNWAIKQQLPLPTQAVSALGQISDPRMLERYAALFEEGYIKKDGQQLARFLYEDLLQNDDQIRAQAWGALQTLDNKEARTYIEQYKELIGHAAPPSRKVPDFGR